MNNSRTRGARQRSQKRRRSGPGSGKPEQYYAALDLGTNSCRMLIARPQQERFEIVDAFSKSVRLGADLERLGRLSDYAIDRTMQALLVCSKKLRRFGVNRARLVATEACRRASNGAEFLSRVESETGLELEIITPAEEARLAVISCAPLLDEQSRQVLVVDIGGGSTELVWIDLADVAPEHRMQAMTHLKPSAEKKAIVDHPGAKVVDWISVPLGVATLLHKYRDVQDDSARFALMSCYFEEHMEEFTPYLEADTEALLDGLQFIGTSGTVTTVGAMHLGLKRYDRSKVDGMVMGAVDVDRVVDRFLTLGPKGRETEPGIGRDRADLIMSGSAILQTLLRIWPTSRMSVADRGLREGMLYSMMTDDGHFSTEPTGV